MDSFSYDMFYGEDYFTTERKEELLKISSELLKIFEKNNLTYDEILRVLHISKIRLGTTIMKLPLA